MTDSDRRRTEGPRRPWKIHDRDQFGLSFPVLNDPLTVCLRFYRDRIEARNRALSVESNVWQFLERLLKSARASYRAACLLVSDSRQDDGFPVQAAMVARSAIEAAGNILFMLDDPVARTRAFWVDHYAHKRKELRRIEKSRSLRKDPRWTDWVERERKQLVKLAKNLRLTDEQASNPDGLPVWPKPSAMLSNGDDGKPRISGERKGVMEGMRTFWYRTQSRFVHQLGDAVIYAVIPNWALPMVRTDAVLPAAVALAIMLSEIEAFGSERWPQRRPSELVDVWAVLARSTDIAKEIYNRRYAGLLGMRVRPLLRRADELLSGATETGPSLPE